MTEKNEPLVDEEQREDKECLLCHSKDYSGKNYRKGDIWHYICPYCGEYEVTGSARGVLLASPERDIMLNHLASLAAERTLQGRGLLLLGTYTDSMNKMISYEEFLKNYPSDFREQHDRALLNLARLANYSPLYVIDSKSINPAALFCNSLKEMYSLLRVYRDESFVNFTEQNIINTVYSIRQVSLTVNGFEYARSLEKDISERQHAFVAMWFHDEMKLYTQEVQKAIRQAGYEPYIANQASYNGLIMDKVLNEISGAKFVIADLTSLPEKDPCTGVRGGVYYEAGYAAGLGLQVILTCREDVTDRIHFDLKQFLGIYWKETDDGKLKVGEFDFVDYLKNHIIKTVGPGLHYGKGESEDSAENSGGAGN